MQSTSGYRRGAYGDVGRWRMTIPQDVSARPPRYGESPRGADSNPTVMFTPVAEVANDRTILVAEDDGNCRRALQHYLKRAGYRVIEAASAAASLETVFASPADL